MENYSNSQYFYAYEATHIAPPAIMQRCHVTTIERNVPDHQFKEPACFLCIDNRSGNARQREHSAESS